MRLILWIPEPLLASPERIFLKFACVLIGLGVLINNYRGTIPIAQLPELVVYELGLGFILGGGAALIGIFRSKRSLERLGLAATAFASLSYALMLAILVGATSMGAILIFTGLAGAAITRLLVSSFAVNLIQQAVKDVE